MSRHAIEFRVNGRRVNLEVDSSERLLDVLRWRLGLTGTKDGCGKGDCGACTVIMDGQTFNACLVLAVQADGRDVITIEGLGQADKLHPLQEAFIEYGAIQCGFCTPGMLLAAKALLDRNPHPSREEIQWALSGNLCRCTGYLQIVEAVEASAEALRGGRL